MSEPNTLNRHQLQLLHSRLIEHLMSAWGECFPMHTWRDPETAVDLMKAEITTLRVEAKQAPVNLEARIAAWVVTRIGPEHMHRRERAMRLLEESIELAQAEGITEEQVAKQASHVYARPAGEPEQEAAAVAVCLFGWCAAAGVKLLDLAHAEILRVEARPIEEIRGSLARKADADLVTVAEGQDGQ